MAINNDGITFNMTEHIDMLNEKTVGGGGYAIPKEYIVQKYLKERINPEIPTATILAALDTRVFEDKAMASAQALMGGPQKSVLEETITETETAMAPRMPQGIAQGQPQQRPPMPGQMPRQMAGLQRPPMPGRVPPQRNNGIPMMAAAGGYVPNFADGGIIGFDGANGSFVKGNKFDADARPFTQGGSDLIPLSKEELLSKPLEFQKEYLARLDFQNKIQSINPQKLKDVELDKKTKNQAIDNPYISSITGPSISEIPSLFGEKKSYGDIIGNTEIDTKSVDIDEVFKRKGELEESFLAEKEYSNTPEQQGDGGNNLYSDSENLKQTINNLNPKEQEWEGAVYEMGVLDETVYEPTNAQKVGDESEAAFQRRLGDSPFTKIAEEAAGEAAKDISKAEKFALGRVMFNFGTGWAESGQLRGAAKKMGKDIDTDMNKITALKKEQKDLRFKIAAIDRGEDMAGAKIGADAEKGQRLYNEKRMMQKNIDKLKLEEINTKKPYWASQTKKNIAEANYLDKIPNAGLTGARKAADELLDKALGGKDNRIRFTGLNNRVESYATNNKMSLDDAAKKLFIETNGLKSRYDYWRSSRDAYDRVKPEINRMLNLTSDNSPVGSTSNYLSPDQKVIRGATPKAGSAADPSAFTVIKSQ